METTDYDDMPDDEIIEKGFGELGDNELYDLLLDFADEVYMNGTVKERGLLAKYMQSGLEIQEGI